MRVRVVTASQAGARDAAAIAAGIPSRALMQRAGAAAAAEIARRYGERLRGGVALFAGPGNNGGDAWVVAGALAAAGARVTLTEVVAAATPDARAEREQVAPLIDVGPSDGGASIVVDGLLGTGSSGKPRGPIADAVDTIASLRSRGAAVVALDIPSGVDATTGARDGAVTADLTLTFGTMKRGLLVARGACGEIAVLDIGLGIHARLDDGAPLLIDGDWVAGRLPPIAPDAHKGTRKRLAIVGGGLGMAGATLLARQAAARSGIGLVRLLVAPPNVAVVQGAAPEAIAALWPASDDDARSGIGEWAHAVLLGPGLGRAPDARALAERVLAAGRLPVVLDADALNMFEGDAGALATLLGGRPAVLTPHVLELARLAGVDARAVLDARFDIGLQLAKRLGAVVLLKGVPTVVSHPDGRCLVSASGTPALAAGGSGDILAGIAATLLAQMEDPFESAACAAWVHGRAAELAGDGRSLRGVTLDDVLESLPAAWRPEPRVPSPPVLVELPRIGER